MQQQIFRRALMAKASAKFDIPGYDFEAMLALQRANFETFVQANALIADATQQAFKVQTDWFTKVFQSGQKAFETKTPMKPEAAFAEAEAMTKEAIKIAKDNVDLGVETQRKVADLVSKRVAANMEEMKINAA
jgi:hypothetical protein